MEYLLGNCPICQRFMLLQHEVCNDCFQSMHALQLFAEHQYRCPLCLMPLLHEDSLCTHSDSHDPILAIFAYKETIKEMILCYKFRGEHRLATTMAYFMRPILMHCIRIYRDIILVPVPCSVKNRKAHGSDHMQRIAKRCEQLYGIPTMNLLKRIGKTVQKELSLENRLIAAKSSFALNEKVCHQLSLNTTIIVIDDVCTSKATLHTCMSLLQQFFSIPVIGLCIAMD